MKQRYLRPSVLAFLCVVALAFVGCGKTQIQEESQIPAVSTPAPAQPAPAPQRPVREQPIQAQPTPPAPPPNTPVTEPAPIRPVDRGGLSQETTSGMARIHFDFDKYNLKPEARDILSKNAEYLKTNQGLRVRIEGHCDERGTTEYNLALGEHRAKSAFQYLMDLGIDPNRMSVVSYGEEQPLDPAQNETAWAKNRRAEFVELR